MFERDLRDVIGKSVDVNLTVDVKVDGSHHNEGADRCCGARDPVDRKGIRAMCLVIL